MAVTTLRDLVALQQRKPPITEQPCATTLKETMPKVIAKLGPAEDAAALERNRKAEIERLGREAVATLVKQLGRRYSPDRASLEKYQCRIAEQARVVERLLAIVPTIGDFCAAGRGLIFHGTVGTGKDHLLAAMLYAAAGAGVSCRWVNGQEIYGRFRDNMDTGGREETIIAELCTPQVLAISDPIPPASAPSAFNLQQLYRLLDRRYRGLQSTWVSLNALSPEDADVKLSAPVFDRLREGAEMFRCFWPSWRERK